MDNKAWAALTPELREALSGDMSRSGLLALQPIPKDLPTVPYTQAGASQLQGQYYDPNMSADRGGVTYHDEAGNSFVMLNPNETPRDKQITHAHEMEHVLANQGLGAGSMINKKYDELSRDAGGAAYRSEIVKRLVEHAPYLQEKWGLDPQDVKEGYFSPSVLKNRYSSNFFAEQTATLSALEQVKNKRLTDDPYVRDNIFKTRGERAVFNALTGLRQSRLDAKDLPPYTPQPDKNDPSTMQKLKKFLGFAKGGMVERQPDDNRRYL
jgi:hypothetical protein